jgi:DNA-binding transcriptional LysR family regulator
MTLRQLEVFLAVARARSYRRAAEALHTSQPALSQHVRELETELAVKVFDRLGRSVALTEAGRLLETHALRVFGALDGAREALGELQGLQRGSLVVGASTTPGIYVLPAVIGHFRRQYPGVDLRLRIANSRLIEERIRSNELDLGVVGGHGLAAGEECLVTGLDDELVLIVSPRHRWARRRTVAPSALASEPLLMREEGSASRDVAVRVLLQARVRYQTAMELDHTEAIKQAVMAGLGVAFVSVHAIRREVAAGHLAAVRLAGVPIRRHFHVIHHEARTLGPSARAFVQMLAVPQRGIRSKAKETPPQAPPIPSPGGGWGRTLRRRGAYGSRRTMASPRNSAPIDSATEPRT